MAAYSTAGKWTHAIKEITDALNKSPLIENMTKIEEETAISKHVTVTWVSSLANFNSIISSSVETERDKIMDNELAPVFPLSTRKYVMQSMKLGEKIAFGTGADEDPAKVKECISIAKEVSTADNYHFLLLSSPNITTVTVPENNMAFNILDDEAQLHQYINFWQIFHKDKNDSIVDSPFCTLYQIKNQEDAKSAIECFFKEKAKNAIAAVIVFLGHGSENGFTFLDGSVWSLGEILIVLTYAFEHRQEGSPLPACLKVVFACCYGHNHSFENKEKIEVFSFTSKDKPEVDIVYWFDTPSEGITDSRHTGLENTEFNVKLQELHQLQNNMNN